MPRKQVSEYLHIDMKTLSKHFGREIRDAVEAANGKIATVLYQKALAGDTVSVLFWLKCRGGWREGVRLEHQLITPPKLGIDFSHGGPGHGGSTVVETDVDEPLDDVPPRQELLPRQAEQWAVLAMSADEFEQHAAKQIPALPSAAAHTHEPLADSRCAGCRQLWVSS